MTLSDAAVMLEQVLPNSPAHAAERLLGSIFSSIAKA